VIGFAVSEDLIFKGKPFKACFQATGIDPQARQEGLSQIDRHVLRLDVSAATSASGVHHPRVFPEGTNHKP
jgi:hypothetical protein